MNSVELFLLGRVLMKLGEQGMPQLAGSQRGRAGERVVLVVATEIAMYPGTTVAEVTARTGLPQSQVSEAVSQLVTAGSVEAGRDPDDGRRTLLRPARRVSSRVAEVRAGSVDGVVAELVGETDLRRVMDALEFLSAKLSPARAGEQ
ncbi:MarR family transcriptional regulator [Rathayibacter sp. CAU 1779]